MGQAVITIRRAGEKDVPVIVELNYALFQEDAGQRDPFMNLNWPREEGHEYFSKLIRTTDSGLRRRGSRRTLPATPLVSKGPAPARRCR